MSLDVEKDGINITYLKGYPSLAAFISSDVDQSAVIYKRFDRLSARSLLHQQSQLVELQRRQDELDRADFLDDDLAVKKNARDFKALCDAAAAGDQWARERLELAELIEEKLRRYKEALVIDSTLLSLRQPTKQAHNAFHSHFMNLESGGNSYPTLGGSSASIYDDRNDLVALARPCDEDRLTKFLRTQCSTLFLKHRPTQNSSLAYISGRRISIVVGVVNVLLASAFLFGAIYNLYNVNEDQIKLGLIAGYTMTFALAISLITNAKRSEIFGACAAYAAVLVVFVSGDLGGNMTTESA